MRIIDLENISHKDVKLAGGKGASLGEMIQSSIPVPPGFVVTTEAFNEFLICNQLEGQIGKYLSGLDIKKIKDIEQAANAVQALILNAPLLPSLEKEILKEFDKYQMLFVAVRSSAAAEDSSTASWAGELETYLNIEREKLGDSVKKCWASLFSPRALVYRIEKKIAAKDCAVAVVVQKMIDPQVAGVVFTVHPVTKNPRKILIEAGWGLGEMVVQGEITPDQYIVDKSKLIIDEIVISDQDKMMKKTKEGNRILPVERLLCSVQKLSGQKIIELTELSLRVENHYQSPRDIEWTLDEENNLWIVQSRPITTL